MSAPEEGWPGELTDEQLLRADRPACSMPECPVPHAGHHHHPWLGTQPCAATHPLNPDCRDGKHKACRGDAWDVRTDQPADCSCECHSPDAAAT